MSYQAADDPVRPHGLPPHRPQRAPAAAALAGAVAELRRRPARGVPARDPAPCLRPRGDPLRPGQQLRPAVRPGRGELRSLDARGLRAVPRRAGDLDQGGLRHVAGTVRTRRRVAEVRARLARPVAGADGAGVRRHLLQPPLRPGHAARGDDRRLDTAVRSGRALYAGISSYSGAQTEGGRDDRPGARHSPADPPAVVLDAQPLDRAGPARRARGAGDGLHRLHRARPGVADRPLPRRRTRRLAGRPAGLDHRRARRRRARPGALAERDRAAAAGRSSPSWRSSGPCATRG